MLRYGWFNKACADDLSLASFWILKIHDETYTSENSLLWTDHIAGQTTDREYQDTIIIDGNI